MKNRSRLVIFKPHSFIWFFIIFYIVWVIRATVFYSVVDTLIPTDGWRLVFSNFMKFFLWVLPAAAYIIWKEKANPLEVMKVNTHLDRRGLITAACGSSLFFVIMFTIQYIVSKQTLTSLLHASPLAILSSLTTTFVSPIIEELLFRGFVLWKLNQRFSFGTANIIQALLFTSIHWPFWIWTKGFQPALLITSLSLTIIALFLGWVCKRTNSIWPPVLVHIVNNFLAGFLG
ncbi:MAG: CPBP family intramembrane metalloprotease [Chloroflexi bacterium]|nr:CPBP family intramembrane metalloprotease [Chloroflexota bacterium]